MEKKKIFLKIQKIIFNTSTSNLFKINKIIERNEDKITVHNYYSSICGTTALVCLLIRDVLEFVGVIPNEKKYSSTFISKFRIFNFCL